MTNKENKKYIFVCTSVLVYVPESVHLYNRVHTTLSEHYTFIIYFYFFSIFYSLVF